MRKNISMANNNGFSLLETTIVLIIISILLSAVIPVLSRAYLEKASNRVILDISAIQEAARKYFIDNSSQWPVANGTYSTPVAALQAGSYLPSAWSAINPFGTSAATPANYSYNVTSNASSLTVCTLVPINAQAIIENSLTSPYIDANGNVCSSVPVPGGGALGLGTPIPESAGVVYYANTDGFVIPTCSNISPGNTALLTGYINGSQFVQHIQNGAGTHTTATFTMPVQKGNNWEVTCSTVPGGSVSTTMYFVPLNS